MIVIDASASCELLLRMPRSTAIADLILAPGETLHAPNPIDIEIAQVVRRFAAGGEINERRGGAALTDLRDLGLQRHRHNLTACDTACVALAELLDASLPTRGRRLAGATVHRARTIVL